MAAAAFLVLVLAFGQGRAGGMADGAAMTTGDPVPPPGGFVLYCLNFPSECLAGHQAPQLIDLEGDAAQTLERVQEEVDAAVRPRVNTDHHWGYPSNGYGDCNAYALEKKRELIAEGLPRSALLLTAAWTETNEGHLVLVARTDRGDLVLDNRVATVLAWPRLPYRWIARQSEENPAMWVAIETPGVPVAQAPGAAVRVASATGGACSEPGLW